MVLGFNNFNMFGSMGSNPLSILGMGCGMGGNPFMSILGGGTCCNSIFGGGMFTDKSGRPDYDAMAGFGVGSFILNIGTSLACQAIQGRGGSGSSKSISGDIADLEKKKQEIISKTDWDENYILNNNNVTNKQTEVTNLENEIKNYDETIDEYDKGNYEKIITTYEGNIKITEEDKKVKINGNVPTENDYNTALQKQTEKTNAEKDKKRATKELTEAKAELKKLKETKTKIEDINSQIEEAQRQLADKAAKKYTIEDNDYNVLFDNNNNFIENKLSGENNKEKNNLAKQALNKALSTYSKNPNENTKQQIKQLYEYLADKDPKSLTNTQVKMYNAL